MKKLLLWTVVLMLIISVVATFSLVSCKAAPVAIEGEKEEAVALAKEGEKAVEEVAVTGEIAIKDEYRFIQIPILVQSWFDQVYDASVEAADILGEAMGTKITIELQSPPEADIIVQNRILEAAIASKPDGIAIDCNDPQAQLSILEEAQKQGIAVVQYVSYSPPGSTVPYVGSDWYQDGINVGMATIERLEKTDNWKAGKVKVAIIQGVPTNSAHANRYQATLDLCAQYEQIEIVAEGFDYDDIEKGKASASQILAAYPDLDAFFTCDAAGPVSVGLAIKEANKVGEIIYVGHDTLPQLAQLMKEGVLDLSIYCVVENFGYWTTVVLMMQNLGISPPFHVDPGFRAMTPENVDQFLQQ